MVGTNTVIKDNPRLNARKWFGNNPVRITFDSKLRINRDFNLMDGSIETLVYCDGRNTKSGNTEHINTDFKNGLLSSVLKDLAKRNIQSVLVEGGRSLLTSFIEEDLWDEARVEVGSVIIESGINAPVLKKCQMIEKNIYGESLVYNYKKV